MSRGRKKVLMRCIAVILTIPVFTGCWNNRELSDLNIVMGLGLDKTDDGKILLTVQVAEPGAIQPSSSASGGGGGEKQEPVFVVSSEGETVLEAIRGMLAVVDKRLFFSVAQVLIISESLAREGIEEILDFFERHHEVSYLMNVLVARGVSPDEILRIESDIDPIPGVYIYGTVENSVSRGTVKKTMLIDLLKEIACKGKQPSIGQITIVGEKKVKTKGLGVFRDGKLVGWLDKDETRGVMFAVDRVESAIVNVLVDEGKAALEVVRSRGTVSVDVENDEPVKLVVRVKVEANVGEYEVKGKLEAPERIKILEKALADEIRKEIGMAIDKCQKEYVSDIFGFGSYLYRFHNRCWKKVGNEWDEVFSELPVEIDVDAAIKRVGMIKNPLTKEE